MDAAPERLDAALDALDAQIVATPARDLAGVALKLRVALYHTGELCPWERPEVVKAFPEASSRVQIAITSTLRDLEHFVAAGMAREA